MLLLVARNYLWAMLATLLVLLLIVLAITDGVVLYARRNALSAQLSAVESVDNAMLMLYEINGGEKEVLVEEIFGPVAVAAE